MADEEKIFTTGAARSNLDHMRLDLVSPIAQLFEGQRYALGAERRGAQNWRKGMPYSVILAHVQHHLALFVLGDRSDDHLAAARWGIGALMEQEYTHPEQNDLFVFPTAVVERVKRKLADQWATLTAEAKASKP